MQTLESAYPSICTVSLSDFESLDSTKRHEFVKSTGDALVDIGFFALRDHGIDQALIDRAYILAQGLFTLSTPQKKSYEIEGLKGQRGYTSLGKETAKGYRVPDLKEFWHVGRELASDHPLASIYGQNIWPTEPSLEEFREVFSTLYAQLDQCADKLLQACALYLGEPENRFSEIARDGNSILRVIHYPPIPDDAEPESIRAAAHEDINLITLLCEATASGLELLDHSGNWRAIQANRGEIIVDSGDMLQNITNGFFKSTTHRVVNPERSHERRFSMPFFCHPKATAHLNPLPSSIQKTGGMARYPDITAQQYLLQRLSEIGLT